MISVSPDFDPDSQKWLHYDTWGPEAALESYPLVMRALMWEYDLQDWDLIDAIPDADPLGLLDLTVNSCTDTPTSASTSWPARPSNS